MKLQGKIVVVTGAKRGIGFKISETLAKEGAKVYATDLGVGDSSNPNIEFVDLNVTDRENIQKFISEIAKKGNIDILVNNAGITSDALIQKMTEDQWDKVLDVNLKGVFNMTQAVAPVMMGNGSGSIINMASIVGIYGNIGQTNYAATKAGVIGMTKVWAKEFARKGAQVRVNSIAPGFIRTPMSDAVPQNIIDFMISRTPLGRVGEPQDVANAVLFLASDDSSFITGQVLGVDGGLVM
ncbi:3-oxoacyl-[acyl-carrier-protein] reductase [Brevinema andersonii]|uniref:3-oxoacyl-[acyl-carrier-protein] reductase n=1 Tax=Brevinema andersonii TaxID=34097 RepID=A0A1I1EY89_BREAD|nr:beta-ketoacyl-ACP reductase [Brevinema andersonii]SFB90468.1 3-oxoacyl-[acyl-carrier-protein] reductase [Brevinema andersonii]